MMTKPAKEAFPISDNVARMRASSTLAAMQTAQAMRAEGIDVVDLGAGEPDFDTRRCTIALSNPSAGWPR